MQIEIPATGSERTKGVHRKTFGFAVSHIPSFGPTENESSQIDWDPEVVAEEARTSSAFKEVLSRSGGPPGEEGSSEDLPSSGGVFGTAGLWTVGRVAGDSALLWRARRFVEANDARKAIDSCRLPDTGGVRSRSRKCGRRLTLSTFALPRRAAARKFCN